MRFDVLTIFPKIIEDYAGESILKRGRQSGKIEIVAHDFRRFAVDKHRKVDDSPYGGGPGMILKPEPIYQCLKAIHALSSRAQRSAVEGSLKHSKRDSSTRSFRSLGRNDKVKVVVLDPAGKKFDQKMAQKFSKLNRLVLICGRYEGFDERIYKFVDEKVSVGDYVLSGGELGALVVTEAVARLIPGVLGNPESLKEETFGRGTHNMEHGTKSRKCYMLHASCFMREYPQYTRPEDFMGFKVPKILLSGNHKKIEEWRRKKSK